LYNYIVRLVPPYLYEADAWFSLVTRLKYSRIVLIYSQDEEGRMVASRFQMLTEDSDIQVKYLITNVQFEIQIIDFKIERIEEYESNVNFTSLISDIISEDHLLSLVFIVHIRFVFEKKQSYILFICSLSIDSKMSMNFFLQ